MRRCTKGIRFFLAASVVAAVTAAPARAGLFITGGNQTVLPGGTASFVTGTTADTISFFISDRDVATDPVADQLALVQLQLRIVRQSGVGTLAFSPVAVQPVPYGSANYVFAGNSTDGSPPAGPFWDSVTSKSVANDTITGGDSINDPSVYPYAAFPNPPGTFSYLLATVQVTAANAAGGDVYQLMLVPASSPDNPNGTDFQDPSNNEIGFTSSPVTVTINATAQQTPVPAPPSLVLAGLGGLLGLVYTRKRRRAT